MGLGYTEVREGQSVTPADQVEMLAELLDILSIDAVDLIANDSGGAVAQLFMVDIRSACARCCSRTAMSNRIVHRPH